MTEDELKAIEAWAGEYVSYGDVRHESSEENRRRDQVMALIAEVRRLQKELEDQEESHYWDMKEAQEMAYR